MCDKDKKLGNLLFLLVFDTLEILRFLDATDSSSIGLEENLFIDSDDAAGINCDGVGISADGLDDVVSSSFD